MTNDALEAPDLLLWVVGGLSRLVTRTFAAHAPQGEPEVVQWTQSMSELVGLDYYSLDEPMNQMQVELFWPLIQPGSQSLDEQSRYER